MKYLSSTPNTLFLLQICSLATVLLGMIIFSFDWIYLIMSLVAFYCYSILGLSVMLHRYYSHRSFELNPVIKWSLTAFAVLAGRGSPLGWVYIHRMHHSTSDTQKDPHSPHFDTFKFIGFRPAYDDTKKINYFIIKELLTPAHIKIDKYYLLFILAFILLLGIIDPALIFYLWAIPTFLVSVTQVAFNYFAHTNGYRNFVTKDRSTNNVYLWPFIMGDAWHNNHHHNPGKFSTQEKWWEFDPAGSLIKIIKK